MNTKIAQYYGIIAGISALCIHFILSLLPYSIIDNIYTNGIYIAVKWALFPLQSFNLPIIYIVLLFTLTAATFYLRFNYRIDKSWTRILVRILNVVGWVILFFYLLWGWNYRASPLKERLALPSVAVDTAEFLKLYKDVTKDLIELRKRIDQDSIASLPFPENEMLHHIDSLERKWLETAGFPVGIPAKVRPLPSGTLLRISTAGFYFPFGGEGYYDNGLHTIAVPFVIAHELAHNYGITDEGEANFVALQTCLLSDNPYIKYSGLLDFWRYVAVTYRIMNEQAYLEERKSIPDQILADLSAIKKAHDRFPDVFPKVRDFIYNFYLKSQGVSSGLKSYAQVIELEMAYRRQYSSRN